MLVQYWHYYDFARREAWQKAGLEEVALAKLTAPDRLA
jgi:hypothetical protein